MAGFAALALVLVVISINLTGQCHAALQIGFYDRKCGLNNVESIVTQEVTKKFIKDRTIAAALIRMYFHDCFVKVCIIIYFFLYRYANNNKFDHFLSYKCHALEFKHHSLST